ncbi:hypothetical protein H257_01222 [Aphanomyces astaci]|uniref:Uncharacterized protein n=1 Tax=Aphanomyces astaci TaxID=112090 RepID=W4H9F8_APHAT|nr:hypothetical protein H257_01222 [Aphanomyces astaci]ETV87753.1 hypothetical protein H257_01222 [Aphanomyces astaci]|eukprot:XP_009822616.1 hypothetical protein H257_01222 [Aphanomyces astaci]
MSNQNRDTASKLPAWEREKLVRLESKLRREKFATNQVPDRGDSGRRRLPSDKSTVQKKRSAVDVKLSDDNPETTGPVKRSADDDATDHQNSMIHKRAPVTTVAMKPPMVHKLAPPTLTSFAARTIHPPQLDDDASSDTNSDEDEKLLDSLEFSIAMSPKKANKAAPRQWMPQSAPQETKPCNNTPERHALSQLQSQPMALTRLPQSQVQSKTAIPESKFNGQRASSVSTTGRLPSPVTPELERESKPTPFNGGEVKPIPTIKAKVIPPPTKETRPIDTHDPPPPRAGVPSEAKPKEASSTIPQTSKATSKSAAVRDATWDIFDLSKAVAVPRHATAEPKPRSDVVQARGRPNALTLSMEEEHLQREISSLNSKLEKVRVSTDSHDEGDDTKNEPDSRNDDDSVETLQAYGGGAHYKAGTRTAPVDRCSMEKRMQMSGVHQTRVRKGVQVHVQDDSKADGKKPDKVVVKKDLALKMLLS